MIKRFAIVLSVIGTLCIAVSAGARMMMCTDEEMQGWGALYGNGYSVACATDGGGDWGIDINLDNPSPYDDEEDALDDACVKAINQCNTTHGADIKSCLIARDNHCGYNPCTHEWKPHCDSSNNCINAYTYCGYLSGNCNEAVWGCAFGDTSKCQFVYSTCRLRSCEETWKPFCDETNNCYISYKYCSNYLSDDCSSAGLGCAFIGDQTYCQQLYNCGVRSCAETWKPFCDQTNNCYISHQYCNHYLSDYCEDAADYCSIGEPKSQKFCDILHNTCKVP